MQSERRFHFHAYARWRTAVTWTTNTTLVFLAVLLATPVAAAESYQTAYRRYQELVAQGDWQTASEYSHRAYEMAREELGEDNLTTARLAHNFALNLSRLNQASGAKHIFKQALRSYELVFGESSVELIPVLLDYADTRMDFPLLKNLSLPDSKEDSGELVERAIRISEQGYGRSSAEHAQVLMQAGFVYARYRNKQGLSVLKASQKLYEKLEMPQEQANATYAIGMLQRKLGNTGQANKALKTALDIIERESVDDLGLKLSTRLELARVLFERDKIDEAKDQRDRAIGVAVALGDAGPELLGSVAAERPRKSAWVNKYEWVSVEYVVDASGNVALPQLINSSGPEVFEEAAIQAVKQFLFLPKVVDGKPVLSRGHAKKFLFYR